MAKKNIKKEEPEEKIEVKGIGISDFISNDVKVFLKENFGESVFPFLGIALLEKEEFIFVSHERLESISNKIITISYEKKVTKKDLDKFIKFLKTKVEK